MECSVYVLSLTSMHSLVFLIACVAGVLGLQSGDNDTVPFQLFARAFDKCSSNPDVFSCLKVKAVSLLDRALSMDSLPISDFMVLSKDPSAQDTPLPSSPEDLEASLPRDLSQKTSVLDQMIQDRLSKYMETRTLQLTMPKDLFEGRRKGYKKGGGVFLVFGAFAAMMLQLALGKIALIAGKALLVGKVALLLAGIIGLKSLLSHGHGEGHSSQVIYAEPEHHGGWGRSLASEDAQHIVYRGQRPSRL